MPAVRPLVLRSALVSLALLMPGLARAGNGVHPRTPVKWEPAPACMTIVDRTIDPKLTFSYTIPYEDLRPADSTDEVEDSRRHQFIGFCADHSPQQPLPEWLSMADVDVAVQLGIIDAGEVKPDNMLETNPEWKDCFTRITADDERRLITFAEAMKPVVWDTTGLPVGAYIISGYTWEPVFNIWSDRPGVVKIVDDPDPAANPPALVITNTDEIKYPGEMITLVGCLDAMDGSTVTGYWAATADDTPDVLEWASFAADTPVSGDAFEVPFLPPEATHGQSIAIKLEIVDPMDRKYTAHMTDLATILEGGPSETGGCTDGGMNFINMPGCDGSGGEESGDTSSDPSAGGTAEPTGSATGDATTSDGATGSGETGPNIEPKDGGCGGCALGDSGVPALLGAPWLLWTVRRRRRA
jgi:hypothetical protein